MLGQHVRHHAVDAVVPAAGVKDYLLQQGKTSIHLFLADYGNVRKGGRANTLSVNFELHKT